MPLEAPRVQGCTLKRPFEESVNEGRIPKRATKGGARGSPLGKKKIPRNPLVMNRTLVIGQDWILPKRNIHLLKQIASAPGIKLYAGQESLSMYHSGCPLRPKKLPKDYFVKNHKRTFRSDGFFTTKNADIDSRNRQSYLGAGPDEPRTTSSGWKC